ncbi:MAG: exodeoxyribonuclease III [Rhodobiaceae bacterium]|nr:exodeoxyribonuclease III [Rhodobiaceae bacterium]
MPKLKTLKVATWNINSVRLRIESVEKFLKEQKPDVLCLQEIKCHNDVFPEKAFKKAGYEHIALNGQKAYHGVATVSRVPLTNIETREFCNKGDARHVAATVPDAGDIRIHNYYVPAGGDEPDVEKNEKFAHKLDFLNEMEAWYKNHKNKKTSKMVLVGDLNIAPFEHDVWSHKQLLKVVSHTPIEVEHLERVQKSHSWIDVMREFVPHDEKLYSWWSYRAKDWKAANKGRRLDHIWVTPAMKGTAKSMEVLTDARGWEKPSDHAPVIATFKV